MVAHAQQGEGDEDDHDDGPEVDELGAEDGGVAVCEHDEVVPLDVAEGEDEVLPPVAPDELRPPLAGAVAVEGEGGVDEGEQDVVEERLEGRDGGSCGREQAREGVGRRDAEREYLPTQLVSSYCI